MVKPGQRERLGVLEVGRFVAAATVLLTHYFGEMAHYANAAWSAVLVNIPLPFPLAVEFFFVLSGFFIMSAHYADFGRAGRVPVFWWRRICRIYPMYWVALGVTLLFLHPPAALGKLLTLALLLPVPAPEFVPPAWTLRYEVGFYIVFGLCLLPYVGRWLLALWVVSTYWLWRPPALAWADWGWGHAMLVWFIQHVTPLLLEPEQFYFFAGLLAAVLFRRCALAGRGIGWLLVAAGGLILASAGPWDAYGVHYGAPMVNAVNGAGLGLVILGLAALERARHISCGAWGYRLGAMTYTAYIMHTSLMLAVSIWLGGRLHLGGPALLLFASLYLAGLMAVLYLLTFAVDMPAQRALRGLAGRFKARVARFETGAG